MLPVFFLNGWRRDLLLCSPLPTRLLGRMLPVFFYTVGGAILYCSIPPTLLLGQMLPVFYSVGGAILYCATPPPTLILGQMLPVFCTAGCAILHCATPPYTIVRADAARFLYGCLSDPLLCYPPLHYCWATFHCATPYTAPRLNAAGFGATSVGVLVDPSLCYPPTLHLG